MTERPTKLIVDCSTGEQHIEPYTDEEWEVSKAQHAEYLEREANAKAEAEAKAEAKASALAKLEALGLTPEEIAAL